ncbi:MAG: hypothetical protein AAGD06_04425 [Acidobacteriota bacterium]
MSRDPLRATGRLVLALLPLFILAVTPNADAAEHRLGLGAHFFKTLDDLADDGFDDVEEDGFAYLASWKVVPGGLIHFQVDVEYYPDGFGGSTSSAFAPTAFVGVGGTFYAAAGVGVTVSSDFQDDVSDPFFAGRVGWELDLLPGISVDLNLNYKAGAFDELEDASTDAITLGAMVRFTL